MTSKNLSPIFEETLLHQHQQDTPYRFTLELGVIITLLFGLLVMQINSINYNTLFLDEAINVVIGGEFIHGDQSRNAMTFHFGSYLYPLISALANMAGGVFAIRLTSTILICLASVLVYFTTRKLFGRRAGLFSLILFSFSGSILNLGQLAVYDPLALFLLAASYLLMVTAVTSDHAQGRLLLASALCAVVCTLAKYIGLIHLPALVMTALLLFWFKGIPVRQALPVLTKYFILPVIYALILYGLYYRHELPQVFQEQGFSPASPALVLGYIIQEMGILTVLAFAGMAFFFFTVVRNRHQDPQTTIGREWHRFNWNALPRLSQMAFVFLLLIVFCTWLASPLQQWLTANSRSLWKNCAYSLVFLAPPAGYCIAAITESLRSRRERFIGNLGFVIACLFFLYLANKALDTNWAFQKSWPNTEGAVAYLREAGLNNQSRVLVEDMDVYEYYFAPEIDNRQVWNNFWYMEYGAVSGQEGALAAIRDRAFDFIIVNNYYFPGIRERIGPLLAEADYMVGWQEIQRLRDGGTVLLQIFIRDEDGSQ